MGVLVLAVGSLVVLAGCYSPSLRDCTVSCAAETDCAAGQICGDDGLCASPERAGRCATLPPDASVDARSDDGPQRDAATPRDAAIDAATPDASPFITLRVQITGPGSVLVAGRSACISSGPQRGDCMYDIARGVPQKVVAVAIEADQPFSSWTSATCHSQDASCTFTPTAATSLAAKFGRN